MRQTREEKADVCLDAFALVNCERRIDPGRETEGIDADQGRFAIKSESFSRKKEEWSGEVYARGLIPWEEGKNLEEEEETKREETDTTGFCWLCW